VGALPLPTQAPPMNATLVAIWDYWLSLYHCGEFFIGVVIATLVCWVRWRAFARR
jgi:hypothetical protein